MLFSLNTTFSLASCTFLMIFEENISYLVICLHYFLNQYLFTLFLGHFANPHWAMFLKRNRKKHIANELLRGLYEAQWEAGEKRKLFTTGEDCLVHVKLWPAVHCLWCLSFNRLVDIMNESDPPSATLERTPALSELRSTLEPLSQSGLSPVAKCRPKRGRAENFCFPHSLMKLAWSLKKGLKENLVSLSCDCWSGNSSVRVTVWTGWSQFRAAPGGIWLALLLLYRASGTRERVFLSTICCSHRHLQPVRKGQSVETWD